MRKGLRVLGLKGLRGGGETTAGIILCAALCLAAGLAEAGVEQYYGKFFADGPASKKEFALTYDDGPGEATGDLLKLLDKYGAKATFFMNGRSMRKYPAAASGVFAAGHLIGNHTDNHLFYPKAGKKPGHEKLLARELAAAEALIIRATGKKPVFMRMPNGYDKDWVRKVAAEKGYILVNWTYGSDWTKLPPESMEAGYLKNVAPGKILLMHDGAKKSREKILRFTEKVLLEARKKGLTPVTLDRLLGIETGAGR